jgi:UDP-glucuronate 4-epimerase
MEKKTILVTGAAGFIGFHLCKKLLTQGHDVIGLDNINNYYSTKLKHDRLKELGIIEVANTLTSSSKYGEKFKFIKLDLINEDGLNQLFRDNTFDIVCNLAAQAGVRYSLENPKAYVESNIVGFLNLLESIRHHKVKKLVYASSSSVYGLNKKVPFETEDNVDNPISLYAASKKSNELMAYTYSHLYGLETIGLRFFTVYGPWGRPDMAMFLFTDAIINNKPIKVYNNGNLSRDFTYIDDIVGGLTKTILIPLPNNLKYSIYNIGNGNPVKLLDFISAIEKSIGKTGEKKFLPMQPGDVEQTWADTKTLEKEYFYKPHTDIQFGVNKFVAWYKDYYEFAS